MSISEQNEPERELSTEEGERAGRDEDMLKYLLSWTTADFISAGFSFLVGRVQGEDASLPEPPNIGSCFTGPFTFFSGEVRAG